MADSDKIITITPNTSVATTHPEIKFVGKDNSPMYLRVLDDNTLSFEGIEGQVFAMSPTMSSGDIFSVNDISGIQSMVVNADGTVTIDAQTKSTTIKNNASNTATLILSNNNADAVDGPILEFFRDTVSPADEDHMGSLVFTGRDDAGNKQEYGRITMHNDDASASSNGGELVFKLTEANTDEQEYLRLRASSRQIEFNTTKDDIDLVWNSDSTDNVLFCNAGTSRIGIGTNSPETLFHVDNGTIQIGLQADDFYTQLSNNALMFHRGAASYIDQQTDNGDIRFRMNAAHDDLLMLDGSAMRVGIGTTSPDAKLDIEQTDGAVHGLKVYRNDDSTSTPLVYLHDDHAFNDSPVLHVKTDRTDQYGYAGIFEGRVGIGTSTPNQKLTVDGSISLKEQADANADTAAYGQLWVNTATPNELYFTTDAGNDIQLTSGTSIAGGGGGISDIVDDTSPQLGGDLDVQTNEIKTTSSNRDIVLRPHGTGGVVIFEAGESFPSSPTPNKGKLTVVHDGGTGPTMLLTDSDGDSFSGPNLNIYRDSSSVNADDIIGSITWQGNNNNAEVVGYASIRSQVKSSADGSENGQMNLSVLASGTHTTMASITTTGLAVTGNVSTTGNISSTSANNYNLYWPLYFQRDNLGTSNIDMRLPVGGAGTSSPNNFAMPRAGKVMALTLHYYGGSLSTDSTKSDTWRIRRLHSGGTEVTLDTVVTMDTLTASANANNRVKTIELSSPMAFNANDSIGFKRNANANSNSIHEVNAVLWIQFDA